MKGKRFRLFNKEFQILASTLPMLVSSEKNPDDETEEQFIAIHDHFILLDEAIQNKLSSPETATSIQSIGKNNDLSLVQMSDIARTVRSYYFNEIKLEDFPNIFSKEMGVDMKKAKEISNIVIQKIINDDSIQKQYESKIEKLAIKDTLKKYPEVGEQLVTGSHIKIKNFPDLVRPSIKNWLSDYTFTAGYSAHNSMDRGTYLFQNENTKKLNSIDRQKLGYILKAYDENSLVNINLTLKQIVFPKIETPHPAAPKPNNVPSQNYLPPKDIYEKEAEISQRTKKNAEQLVNQPLKISDLAPKINKKKTKLDSPRGFSKDIYKKEAAVRPEAKKNLKQHINQPLEQSPKIPSLAAKNNEERVDLRSPLRFSRDTDEKEDEFFLKPEENLTQHINQAPRISSLASKINEERINFSSPHKFPYEKQEEIQEEVAEEAPEDIQPQPMRITPRGFRRDFSQEQDKDLGITLKNVVDLRE